MLQDYRPILRYGFGLLAVVSGFLLFFFISWTSEELLPVFEAFNSEREWLFPWNKFSGTYNLNNSFYSATKAFYALVFSLSLLLWHRLRIQELTLQESITGIFNFFRRRFNQGWRTFSKTEKRLIAVTGIFLTCLRFYFLAENRIGLDDALSYMLFIDKGLPGILLYYPLPNNHIFYNLLCWPLRFIFSDPYWTMELPAFFIASGSMAVLYFASRALFNFPTAYLLNLLFSASTIAFYYAIHGRGYFLVATCTILAAISLYKIHCTRNTRCWFLFISCSIIGFYTIPVYLYGFLAITCWAGLSFIFSRNWLAFKQLLLAGIFISFAVACLYLPIIIGSGVDLLFFNIYVAGLPTNLFFQRLLQKVIYLQGFILGQETTGFFAWLAGFMVISGLLFFRKRAHFFYKANAITPNLLFLIWCVMLLPYLIFIIQRSDPPERTFFFKAYFDFAAFSLLFIAGLKLVFKNNSKAILAGVLAVGLMFSFYETRKFFRSELQQPIFDAGFDDRLETLTQTGAKIIYANNMPYSGHLRYTFFRKGFKNIIIDEGLPVSGRNYEMLILSSTYPIKNNFNLLRYHLIHQDNLVHIYLLKNKNQQN